MKVLIVDDEPLAREELHYLVEQNPDVEAVYEADGVNEAQQVLAEQHPQLMLLDIQLTDGSGMALAESLKSLSKHPYIVFATAYDQYAVDAFKADAIDYILKPFSQDRVNDAISKVQKIISSSTGKEPIAKREKTQQTNPPLSFKKRQSFIFKFRVVKRWFRYRMVTKLVVSSH